MGSEEGEEDKEPAFFFGEATPFTSCTPAEEEVVAMGSDGCWGVWLGGTGLSLGSSSLDEGEESLDSSPSLAAADPLRRSLAGD